MGRRTWVAALAAAVLSVGLAAAPGPGSAPAAALTLPPRTSDVACPGWSGLHTTNPYTEVMAGYVRIPGYAAVRVAPGGTVAWAANPFKNLSWRTWFTSLKWVGGLVWVGLGRGVTVNGVTHPSTDAERAAALTRATAIVASYLRANPRVTTAPTTEQIASMGHRTQVLACLAEATVSPPAWLVNAARAHAAYVAAHWKGAWNQGLEQDLGALAVGCIVGPRTIATAAATRMDYALTRSVLPDGASNEQAPGYAGYSYRQWTIAAAQLDRCGLPQPAGFARLPLLAQFIAQATQPDGNLVQIGDTAAAPPASVAGTPLEYAASLGAVGTPPADRVGVYRYGGYVLGRDSWTPMRGSMFYSLRFGPGTTLHGHFDHTAVTYQARGHNVLMDTGFPGYALVSLRKASWQMAAHNELILTGVNPTHTVATLSRSVQSDLYDAYTVGDVAHLGVNRTRSVLVTRGEAPDLMVVSDAASATKAKLVPRITVGVYRQHWHLPPGWKVARNSHDRITAVTPTEKITLVRVPVTGTPSRRTTALAASFQASGVGAYRANVDAQFLSTGWSTRMLTVVVPSSLSDAVTAVRTVASDGTTPVLRVTVGAQTVWVTLDTAFRPVSAALAAP